MDYEVLEGISSLVGAFQIELYKVNMSIKSMVPLAYVTLFLRLTCFKFEVSFIIESVGCLEINSQSDRLKLSRKQVWLGLSPPHHLTLASL